MKELVIAEIIKLIIFRTFRSDTKASYRASAELIVDGCNMGIKTLCRYENQYAAADDAAMKLTDDLIRLEEKLRQDLREYL